MTALRALVLVFVCGAAVSVHGQEQTRRLYVTALGANDAAVANLAPEDVTVKESGKVRPVQRLEPAQTKMSIAIIVDDNGTGIFRVAVARFIETLLTRAEFALSVVRGQTVKLVDYTSDARRLSEALQQIGAQPSNNDGNQLLDGITGASLDMAKRKAGRPVIVALTVGGDDVTPMQPDDALDDLRKSGAQLYVVSMFSSSLRPLAPRGKPADMLNEGHALGAMLGDGPAWSGGYREDISAMAGVDPRLQRLAAQLTQQYVLEYSLAGSKPSKTVSVSVKRKDVTLRAPTHVPDKF
jgi:VWFA-related protein